MAVNTHKIAIKNHYSEKNTLGLTKDKPYYIHGEKKSCCRKGDPTFYLVQLDSPDIESSVCEYCKQGSDPENGLHWMGSGWFKDLEKRKHSLKKSNVKVNTIVLETVDLKLV